jgi:hypothetical protein
MNEPGQVAQLGARDFIKLALEKGMKPSEIKAELRQAGITTPWKYSYTGHCGNRARTRYSRQAGLCVEGCGAVAPKHRRPRICDTCLERKWAE